MESVQVEIYGQKYHIKGAGDPAHIRELADYLDAKMKEVEKGTGTIDPHRVAILTAMTIADELHRLRKQYYDLELSTDNAAKRLLILTDTVPDT